MSIYSNTPYTYRIKWSKTGMNYYGVRFAKECQPDDLWQTYFTSSKYVTEYRLQHGEPDIIEVRKTFKGDDRRNLAIDWETRTLLRLNASSRSDFLNKHHNGAYDHHNPEIEEKRLLAIAKTKGTDEFKSKVSGDNWWRTDKNIYHFIHKDGRTETCTRIELCIKHNLKADKITRLIHESDKSRKSHGGWMLAGTTYAPRGGSNSVNFDHAVYNFINDDGMMETCTRYHLYTTYHLQPTKVMLLIQGKRKSHKGWRIVPSHD